LLQQQQQRQMASYCRRRRPPPPQISFELRLCEPKATCEIEEFEEFCEISADRSL
jgi:hypothetical protein